MWCPGYDTKLHLMMRLQFRDKESVEYPFTAITLSSLKPRVLVPVRIPSVGQIDRLKNIRIQ